MSKLEGPKNMNLEVLSPVNERDGASRAGRDGENHFGDASLPSGYAEAGREEHGPKETSPEFEQASASFEAAPPVDSLKTSDQVNPNKEER